MKSSKILSTLLRTILLGACAVNSSTALADLPLGIIGSNTSYNDDYSMLSKSGCTSNSNCYAGGYSNIVQSLLFQPGYNQVGAMAAGSVLATILTPPAEYSLKFDSKTSQGVLLIIANQSGATDNLLTDRPTIFASNIVLGATNGTTIKIPFSNKTFTLSTSTNSADKQSALDSLSFDSVISPLGYQKVKSGNNAGSDKSGEINQQEVADTFIQYVTGLANPMPTADFTKTKVPTDGGYNGSIPAYLIDLQKNPDVKNYLLALRTYAAQLSVGISNYYYLYHERMPIKDPVIYNQAMAILNQSGSATTPIPPDASLSPLKVEQIIATRRIYDPQWYTAMQNALPSTLMRETLFLLAEIPPMLFQLHLDLERLLATMSTMQIQQAGSTRLTLQQQSDKVNNLLQTPPQSQTEAQQAANQASQQVNQAEIEQAKQALNQSNNVG